MSSEVARTLKSPLTIDSSLLVRNTALNFLGQAIPLLVGILIIPFLIRGVGTERFGILSLAWVLLGYFSLLDLGLGRATTKFVAGYLGRGEMEQLPKFVWTSLGVQAGLGAMGGLLAGACVPLLVDKVLQIPPALVAETRNTFFILAASFPLVVTTTTLRGVLEAGQRFDLVNYVRVPASISVFLFPAMAVFFGFHLPGIVLLLVAARLAATLAYFGLCLKIVPSLRKHLSFDFTMLRPLVSFGGWVMVTNVVSPLLVFMERFLIGARLPVAALGYYAPPHEVVTRLGIIPGSLAATLFPAFSSLKASGASERLGEIYARSIKFLLLVLGPLLLLMAGFAHEILQLWLGVDFAEKSAPVLQILAVGVLVNSLAFIPFSLVQGLGRPDVTAKFHLLELPFFAALAWFLIGKMGIAGAALAWTVRVGVDMILLFGASWWLRLVPRHTLWANGLLQSLLGFSVLVAVFLFTVMAEGLQILSRVSLAVVLIVCFAVATWYYFFDNEDRSFVGSAMAQFVGIIRATR